jgi:subtilase family serine protease
MISNLGDQDAKKFQYRLYLSADDQLSEDDLLISTKAAKKLAADASRKVKFNHKLELNSSASGKYLLLQTDSEQSVEETNESDNVVATSQVP